MSAHHRVEVMHGVNLNQLGRRDPGHYGSITLDQLEQEIERWGKELGMVTTFFRSNHEGAFVERLHLLDGMSDAVILNPGAWTHYSWAIRDALEVTGLPAVEVHLSAVEEREEWRQLSVLDGLVEAKISGKGADGYRDALQLIAELLR